MTGKTISHYKILEKLGEGGMGVVYKAQDTKLDREVALKFLPTNTITSKEEKTRFEQEAKAAAKLSHANIATVHAIDEVDGQTFIAMEYVEGETLANMIDRGPLKLADAIKIATQIAVGLQAAHKKNITHRDIKSANIMVTEDRHVKIMDFGLAKLSGRSMVTKAGTTLGTASYMSPEQAKGESADSRSDIWSLGVILYEMISGQLPFKGDYEQAVVYGILNEDPEPLTALRSGIPMALDGIIAKALAKDRDTRYQHVDELPADLKAMDRQPGRLSISSTLNPQQATERSILPRIMKNGLPWGVAIFMTAIMVMTLWGPWRQPVLSPLPVSRFEIQLPGRLNSEDRSHNFAVSPDGSKFVFAIYDENGQAMLYFRLVDQFGVKPIPETEGARSPCFSPDGTWVAFMTRRALRKVSLSSGVVVTLSSVQPASFGCSWELDGNIYFTESPIGGVYRVSSEGGVPESVTTPDSTQGEIGHHFSMLLPGGRAFLFTVRTKEKNYDRPAVFSLEAETWQQLAERGTAPQYSPSGHVIYMHSGHILATPFDLDRLQITGPSTRLVAGVLEKRYKVSLNGTLLYASDSGVRKRSLVWVDRKGNQEKLPFDEGQYWSAKLSPKGSHLAVSIEQAANSEIWVGSLNPPLTRMTNNPNWDGRMIWRFDGRRIIFSSQKGDEAPNIFVMPADGSAAEELLEMAAHPELETSGYAQFATSISRDGQFLAFTDETSETGLDIWVLPLNNERIPQPWLKTEYTETAAVFSPDGHWIAYQSDVSGRFEIYVQRYPGSSSIHQVSTDGGTEPLWEYSGEELFYRQGNNMVAVSVATEPNFSAGQPQVLFTGRYEGDRITAAYDISPNGDRFLMVAQGLDEEITQIKVVSNWSRELLNVSK